MSYDQQACGQAQSQAWAMEQARGMQNALGNQISKGPSLATALETLAARVGGLAETIKRLEDTLNPVLLPNSPTPPDGGAKEVNQASPAIRLVDENCERLYSLERHLSSILRRVAL